MARSTTRLTKSFITRPSPCLAMLPGALPPAQATHLMDKTRHSPRVSTKPRYSRITHLPVDHNFYSSPPRIPRRMPPQPRWDPQDEQDRLEFPSASWYSCHTAAGLARHT